MSTKCKLCNGDLTAPGREGGVYLTGIGPIGGDCTRRIVTAAAYEYPVATPGACSPARTVASTSSSRWSTAEGGTRHHSDPTR